MAPQTPTPDVQISPFAKESILPGFWEKLVRAKYRPTPYVALEVFHDDTHLLSITHMTQLRRWHWRMFIQAKTVLIINLGEVQFSLKGKYGSISEFQREYNIDIWLKVKDSALFAIIQRQPSDIKDRIHKEIDSAIRYQAPALEEQNTTVSFVYNSIIQELERIFNQNYGLTISRQRLNLGRDVAVDQMAAMQIQGELARAKEMQEARVKEVAMHHEKKLDWMHEQERAVQQTVAANINQRVAELFAQGYSIEEVKGRAQEFLPQYSAPQIGDIVNRVQQDAYSRGRSPHPGMPNALLPGTPPDQRMIPGPDQRMIPGPAFPTNMGPNNGYPPNPNLGPNLNPGSSYPPNQPTPSHLTSNLVMSQPTPSHLTSNLVMGQPASAPSFPPNTGNFDTGNANRYNAPSGPISEPLYPGQVAPQQDFPPNMGNYNTGNANRYNAPTNSSSGPIYPGQVAPQQDFPPSMGNFDGNHPNLNSRITGPTSSPLHVGQAPPPPMSNTSQPMQNYRHEQPSLATNNNPYYCTNIGIGVHRLTQEQKQALDNEIGVTNIHFIIRFIHPQGAAAGKLQEGDYIEQIAGIDVADEHHLMRIDQEALSIPKLLIRVTRGQGTFDVLLWDRAFPRETAPRVW